MKKFISISALFLAVILALGGCKSNSTAMSDYNLDEYLKLSEYKGIEIDKSTEQFKLGVEYSHYQNFSDEEDNSETLKEGTVQALDTVNIDYEGKKGGVAFEGGTDKGYDLLIGSSSFIEGFETGLIGVKVGETVDINLTFPKNYSSEELAGQDVVFTVKVNSISRPEVQPIDEEAAEEMGYGSVKEYQKALEDDYIKNIIWRKVVNESEIIMYPEGPLNAFVESNIKSIKEQAEEYGVTTEQMLSQYGFSEESYKEYLRDDPNYLLAQEMVFYAIADRENINVDDAEVETFIKDKYGDAAKVTDEDRELILKSLIQEKVLNFLVDNAVIS